MSAETRRRPPVAVPMHRVIALELSVLGGHGMAAHAYGPMPDMIAVGALDPGLLVTRMIGLEEAPALAALDATPATPGTTVILPTR